MSVSARWVDDTIARATATLAANTTFRVVSDRDGTPVSEESRLDAIEAFLAASGDLIANLSDHWDDAGATWYGVRQNVVDDGSGANSRLIQLERNGTANFYVDKYGVDLFLRGDVGGDGSAVRNFKLTNSGGNSWQVQVTGSAVLGLDGGSTGAGADVKLRGDVGVFGFTANSSVTVGIDTAVQRDAADTWAHRRGNNAQTVNRYGTYASPTNYQRMSMSVAKATLSGVSGASVTATGLIPAGAELKGLTTRVTTGLGTGGGTTGYAIGDGSDANRWGSVTGTVAGTTTDDRNWTDFSRFKQAAAQDVVVTALGGDFNGTGVIEICAFYQRGEAD